MTDELVVEHRGPALWVTIDRPERRNALSPAVLEGIAAAVRGVRPADGVRAVVVTGSGDRAFCSGMDLESTRGDATVLEQHERRGLFIRLFEAFWECPVPVVTRVQGICLAGGMGLLTASDIAIAADHVEFALTEVNLGLWPFMVGALVARHTAPKRAFEWASSGRRIGAAEAYDWGLLSRVVPAAELDAAVDEVVSGLAAKSPVALRLGKAAWYRTASQPITDALPYLQSQLSLLLQSRDATEGISAFLEKRPPEWSGR